MLSNEEKQKVRLLQNQYHREWRKNNTEKVKAINERFWLKKLQNQERSN